MAPPLIRRPTARTRTVRPAHKILVLVNSLIILVIVNSLDDFCLFAPPKPGKDSEIGDSEQIEVSWCMQDGYGTRLIPDGSITGVTFIQTPDFVQVTGVGDLTSMNIPKGDEGGELDPHGATGLGNPIGGLVFSNAFGKLEQIHEWTVRLASSFHMLAPFLSVICQTMNSLRHFLITPMRPQHVY